MHLRLYKQTIALLLLLRHFPTSIKGDYRPGSATRSNSCQHVRRVPAKLRSWLVMKPRGLASFYQKYTEAYNIPVVSSGRVPDDALRRACYVLRFLLAGNSAVRNSFYRMSGRVAVIGRTESTTWIPEHSVFPESMNQRARGLGATARIPVSSGGEENILCYRNDRYANEDIFLHETSHAVHLLGATYGIPGWERRLGVLYNQAWSRGLWANTYSMTNVNEYFGSGTQSFFDVNAYSANPDGIRGPINTRVKLWGYDPQLYAMIQEVFPCNNYYYKRCSTNRALENAQLLKMDCDLYGPGGRGGGKGRGTAKNSTGSRGGGKRKGTGNKSTGGRGGGIIKGTAKNSTGSRGGGKRKGTGNKSTGGGRKGTGKNSSTFFKPGSRGRGRGGTDSRDCGNSDKDCPQWAIDGECYTNPTYMLHSCKRSCNLCKRPPN